jgi:hypothetical protein
MVGSLWFGLICVAIFALLQTWKKGRSIFE